MDPKLVGGQPEERYNVADRLSAGLAWQETAVADAVKLVKAGTGEGAKKVFTFNYDVNGQQTADNLMSGGWISRTSTDRAVLIFQNDGAKYVLRSRNSSGHQGWTADFTPAGSTRHILGLRLGYTP